MHSSTAGPSNSAENYPKRVSKVQVLGKSKILHMYINPHYPN